MVIFEERIRGQCAGDLNSREMMGARNGLDEMEDGNIEWENKC